MMKIRFFQKGFNYAQDGRGNRLVLHLQGCNLRCPWCANPEGLSPAGALMVDFDWLTAACCPRGAVQNGALDRAMCRSCPDRPCTALRQKGIRLSCAEIGVDDLLAECVGASPMFFDGGGVTLTGGEVCMQLDAVKELLAGLGERGIHRAIETNGTLPGAADLIPLVDEWIMDVKHWDDQKHRQWLGAGNANVLDTLNRVCACHADVLVRIPLMPGFNDSPADADAFAALLGPVAARDNVRAEVLVYHVFGKSKWAQCGMAYTMSGRVAPEARTRLEAALRDAGLHVVRT